MHIHIIDESEYHDDELDFIDLAPLPYSDRFPDVRKTLCTCGESDCHDCQD